MANDIQSRHTRIAELIPLHASALGFHDASGDGAGGVWFPSQSLDPRFTPGSTPTAAPHAPLLWRYQWPADIIANLVSSSNPHGTITNSDLELAGGLLHLEAIAHYYDVRERTVLSKTDNLATLFWQRKGNATTAAAPSFLLRLFGIHQRYHRYVPRHDYISGKSNPMADDSSRLFHLTDIQFLSHFNSQFPQNKSFHHVHLPSATISAVISALRMKTSPLESLLVAPPAPIPIGQPGSATPLTWASIPFSKPSKTPYLSYKSSSEEFEPELYQQAAIPSSLDRLKITYGRLDKRSLHWGSRTHA